MKGAWRRIVRSERSCGRWDEEDYKDVLSMDEGSTDVEGESKLAVERVMWWDQQRCRVGAMGMAELD